MQQRRWTMRGLVLPVLMVGVLVMGWPGIARADDAARRQFIFAYKLLQQGDDHLSADAFDQYLGDFPHAAMHSDGLYFRALLYHRAGKDKLAEQLLAKAGKPKLVPGYAILLLRGQVLTDLKQYKNAVATLEKIDVKGLKPQVAQALAYLKGLAYRGAGNLQAAADSLKQAGQGHQATAGQALLDLARVQVQMGNKPAAIKTLSKAVKFDAVAAKAAHLAGDLSYDEGHYQKSVTFYKMVIANHQNSTDFQPAMLGVLWSHYSAGRYQAAIKAYAAYAKMLSGGHATAAAYLAGSSQMELGKDKAAEKLLTAAAEGAAPADATLQAKAFYKLTQCEFKLKQYAAIDHTLQQMHPRYPKSQWTIDATLLRARAKAAQGDVAAGTAILTRLMDNGTNTPYYAEALLARANLYDGHGQLKAAAADYQKYVRLNAAAKGKVDHARLHLIDVDDRLGRYAQAARQAARLLAVKRLDPAVRQEGLYRQALALIKLGKAKAALAAFRTLDRQFPLNAYHAASIYYRGLLEMSLNHGKAAEALLRQAAGEKALGKDQRIDALGLIATQQRQDGDKQAAGRTLEQVVKLGGIKALANQQLLTLAKARLVRGDGKGALLLANQLVRQRGSATVKQQAYALYLTGEAQRDMRQYGAAEQSFRHVIALGQGHELDATLALGRTLAAAGRNEAALNALAGLVNVASDRLAAEALFEQAKIYRTMAQQDRRQQEPAAANKARKSARERLSRLVLLYSVNDLNPLPLQARIMLAEVDRTLGLKQAAGKQWQALIDDDADSPYATYAKAMQAADPGKKKALLGKLAGEKLDRFLAGRVKQDIKALGGG